MTDAHLYCRLCFSICQDPECYTPLSGQSEGGPRQMEIRNILESLIPTLDLTLTRSPGICSHCEDTLYFAADLIFQSVQNQDTLLIYKTHNKGQLINIHNVVESTNSNVRSCHQDFVEDNYLITNNGDIVENNTSTNKRRTKLNRMNNKKQKLNCTYLESNIKEIKNSDDAVSCTLSPPLPQQGYLYTLRNRKETAYNFFEKITQETGQQYSNMCVNQTDIWQTTSNSSKKDIQEPISNPLNCSTSTQLLAAQITKTKQLKNVQSILSENLDIPLFPPLRTVVGGNPLLWPNTKTHSFSRNCEENVNNSSNKNAPGSDIQIDSLPNGVSNPDIPLFPPLKKVVGGNPFLKPSTKTYSFLSNCEEKVNNSFNKNAQGSDGQIDSKPNGVSNPDIPLLPPLKRVVGGNPFLKPNTKTYSISRNFKENSSNSFNKNTQGSNGQIDNQPNKVSNPDTLLSPSLSEQRNLFVLPYLKKDHTVTNPSYGAMDLSKKNIPVTVGNESNCTSSAHLLAIQLTKTKQAQIDSQPSGSGNLAATLFPPLMKHANLHLKPNSKIFLISRSTNFSTYRNTHETEQTEKQFSCTRNLDTPLSPPLLEQGNIYGQPYFMSNANNSFNKNVQGTDGRIDNKNPDTPLSPPLPEKGNLYVKANKTICHVSKNLEKKVNNSSIQKTVQTNEQLNNITDSNTPLSPQLSKQGNFYLKANNNICHILKNLDEKVNNYSNKNIQETVQIDEQLNSIGNSDTPLSPPLLEQGNNYVQPYFNILCHTSPNPTNMASHSFNKDVQVTVKNESNSLAPAQFLATQFTSIKQGQIDNQSIRGKNLVTPLTLPLLQRENLYLKPNTKMDYILKSHEDKSNKFSCREVQVTNEQVYKEPHSFKNPPFSSPLPEQGTFRMCGISRRLYEKVNNSFNKRAQGNDGAKLLATQLTKTKQEQNMYQSSKGKPLSSPLVHQENLYKKTNSKTRRKRKANNSSNKNTQQASGEINYHPNSIRKTKTLLSPPQGTLNNNSHQFSYSLINPENENLIQFNETKKLQGTFDNINILIKSEPMQMDDDSDISLSPIPEQEKIFVMCDTPAISNQREANNTAKEDTKENVKLKNISSPEIMVDTFQTTKPVQAYGRPFKIKPNASSLLPLKSQGNIFVNSNSQISSWKEANKDICSPTTTNFNYYNYLDTSLSPPMSEQGNLYMQPYSKLCHILTNPRGPTGTVRDKPNNSASTQLLAAQFTQSKQGQIRYQPNKNRIVNTPLPSPLPEQGNDDDQPESIKQPDTPQSPPLTEQGTVSGQSFSNIYIMIDPSKQDDNSSNKETPGTVRDKTNYPALAQLIVAHLSKTQQGQIKEQSNSSTNPNISLLKQDNVNKVNPPYGGGRGSPCRIKIVVMKSPRK